ncbi:MAG: ergothioneine biosynthesis protein EgtB [Terriglobales bacterium]
MGAVSCHVLPASGLAQHYQDVRRTTEALCAPLSADDQMVQSTPEASPVKWHQAHTTWFFETFILAPHLQDYRPLDARFRTLFNSYYKQVGEHPLRTIRNTFSRPTLEEVRIYRHYVDEHMLKLLAERGDDPQLKPLVELGCNHEQQHQELILTDIKHAFWSNPLRPAYPHQPIAETSGNVPEMGWLKFDGGIYAIGHDGHGFAFDNEGPRHEVLLRPFVLASRLVTNREYLEFMNDGGYRRPELWLSDGWDAVQASHWNAPLYWEERDGGWLTFSSGGMREVRLDEPVCHVSYYEADAFARWAGARLATETEWEIAARPLPIEGNLLESGRFHPALAAGDNNALQQMFGDVWEWTASPYVAYPGFRAVSGALGEYNGKFMCNQMVLRGGSCVTPISHLRASYRNFFPPEARWQFMGIRLANEHR